MPAVADAILQELGDQRSHLKLIASENFASPSVLLAMGNWLSDKYAEGAPGHRLYAGCDNVDASSREPTSWRASCSAPTTPTCSPTAGSTPTWSRSGRCCPSGSSHRRSERLGAGHVNDLADEDWESLRQRARQPDAAGHVARRRRPPDPRLPPQHLRQAVPPPLLRRRSRDSLLDYDEVRRRAHEERPLILIAGYSSYPRLVNFRVLREIADEVGATFMVDMAHFAGLVAGKVLTGDYDPVPHAHIVTTTTHKTLRGPRGGLVLCQQGARRDRRPRLSAGAGRSAAARHGGQGRRARRSVAAVLPGLRGSGRRQRAGRSPTR